MTESELHYKTLMTLGAGVVAFILFTIACILWPTVMMVLVCLLTTVGCIILMGQMAYWMVSDHYRQMEMWKEE